MIGLALLLFFQGPDSTLLATFTPLRSAAARFRHDLPNASAQLVLSRAQRVRTACADSRAAADSVALRLARNAAAQSELAALQRALIGCLRDWEITGPRANADSLRAWGPHRLSELDRALRRYQRARLVRSNSPAP
jgi:hypothetical protein